MPLRKTPPNPIDVHVGARVRQGRLIIGLSQEKLAFPLGVTFQQVQKNEQGTNRIGASRLQKISQILGKPISWFYEGVPSQGTIMGPQSDDPLQALAMSPLGVNLARAFNAIHDPALRHALVKTVEAAAAISGPANRKAA